MPKPGTYEQGLNHYSSAIFNMRRDVLAKPSTNMNRQYGGFISRTDHRLPIAPCRFCNGDHWNDSCTKYKTANARKQVIKHSCYVISASNLVTELSNAEFLSPAFTADKNTITIEVFVKRSLEH